MSFYRRYAGLQPGMLPVADGTAPILGEALVGPITQAFAPVFAPPPLEIQSFSPTNQIRAPLPFLATDPRVAESLAPPGSLSTEPLFSPAVAPRGIAPVDVAPAPFFGPAIVPSPLQPIFAPFVPSITGTGGSAYATIERAAVSDDRAAQAAAAAQDAARIANAAIFEANKVAARADADATAASAAAAEARQREAARLKAASDAAQAKADTAAAKAAADAQAAAVATANERASGGTPDVATQNWTSGGGDVPLVAWDQRDPAEAIPMPDGTVAMVAKKPSMLAVAAGAGGGFLVGGPVGALVGAAAGYFLTKK